MMPIKLNGLGRISKGRSLLAGKSGLTGRQENRLQAGSYLWKLGAWCCIALFILLPAAVFAQETVATPAEAAAPWRLALDLEGGTGKAGSASVGVQIVVVMTLLSVAPSLILLMTSFTRIVIVLGFVRTAIGVPSAPANQIITGLALFLTLFIMGPVLEKSYKNGIQPYMEGKQGTAEALEAATQPLREFMLKQTRTRDLEFFLQLGRFPATKVDDLPLRVVVPAYVISELQTAFQMGFLIFLPFLVIDLLVSATLMALGMMMMPPATIALPFKLLLFVLVDGWHLVVQSLVTSFRV
jgi:flagellar biosynthetic protein FliP